MKEWLNAEVVEKRQWTDRLFSLRLKADFPTFQAGQFTQLADEIDGEIVSRPFSLVNPPEDDILEFYFIEVLNGLLSTRLAKLQEGDGLLVAPRATGLLTVAQLPQAKHLYMLATGTGIGPFLSIIRTSLPWQQFDKVVLVHGVRFQHELTYQDLIKQVQAEHGEQFSYVPFVSRDKSDLAMSGRVTDAIVDKRLEQHLQLEISAEHSHFMLCGNPAMVQECMQILADRGLKKHSRRESGHISIEKYW